MNHQQIEYIAKGQMDFWEEMDGKIEYFDVKSGEIDIGGSTFKTSLTCRDQILQRLHLLGTCRDFSKDKAFLQQAIDRKVETLKANPKANPSRIIFDVNTGEAKALKTSKYKRIHNHTILDMVVKRYGKDISDQFSYINDERMVLYYESIDKTDAKVGDMVGFGVRVWNSETGHTGLGADQTFFRLSCKNGAVVPFSAAQQKINHVYAEIMERFAATLHSVYQPAVVQAKIAKAQGRPALVDHVDELPQLLNVYRIPSYHHKHIVDAYVEEPLGLNNWGVYAAITRYASNSLKDSHERMLLIEAAYPLIR